MAATHFHKGAIDLYATHSRFYEKFNRVGVSRKRFGQPVVNLARDVLGGRFGLEAGEVEGVRNCFTHLVRRLRRRNYLWIVPLNEEQLFVPFPFGGLSELDRDNLTLLVDSLMLTVTDYRQELQEHHTGLAPEVFAHVLLGFELVCYWAHRYIPLTPEKNDLIVTLDVPNVVARLVRAPE